MILKSIAVLAMMGCLVFATQDKQEEKKSDDTKTEVKAELKDVKCLLMPKKDVKDTFAVDYMESKVYFCCKGCVKKFSGDPDKYATKANHQLVQTKLFKQTGCPFSGGEVDDSTELAVAGVKVKFCCDNCKAKVEAKSTDEEKVELVFTTDTFKKGFAKVEAEKEEGDSVEESDK